MSPTSLPLKMTKRSESRILTDNWRLSTSKTHIRQRNYFMGMRTTDEPLRAIIYAEGGLTTALGKTAHGLLRYSPRYRILAVVDSTYASSSITTLGREVAVMPTLRSALKRYRDAEVLVVGIAPTGLTRFIKVADTALEALQAGLSVHNGLHSFLADLPDLVQAATDNGVDIVDIRKPPREPRIFNGEISSVNIPRLLVTGQDAAIGKRTACIRISEYLSSSLTCCLIGTGQTAWLQAFPYGIRLDALPIDFATGELEGAVVQAARDLKPNLIIIEGQGGLLNPGYGPETLALLSGTKPNMMIYVMAPGRRKYLDFPTCTLPTPEREMSLLEELAGVPVIGVVVNDEDADLRYVNFGALDDRPMSVGIGGDLSEIAKAVLKATV